MGEYHNNLLDKIGQSGLRTRIHFECYCSKVCRVAVARQTNNSRFEKSTADDNQTVKDLHMLIDLSLIKSYNYMWYKYSLVNCFCLLKRLNHFNHNC